jgi:hypothetical protein
VYRREDGSLHLAASVGEGGLRGPIPQAVWLDCEYATEVPGIDWSTMAGPNWCNNAQSFVQRY